MIDWTSLQRLGVTLMLLGTAVCTALTLASADTLFFWYYGKQTGSGVGWWLRTQVDDARLNFAVAGVAGLCCIVGMYLSRHIDGAWFFRIIGSSAIAYWAVSLGYIAFESRFV